MLDISNRINSESLLGKLIRLPLRCVPKNTVIPILQGPLRGYRWVVGSGVHGYWVGSFESIKQLWLAQALTPNDVFFDVGANAGFYTLLGAKQSARVFAFEPLPENIRSIETHLRINSIGNATLIPAAVAAANGEAMFQIAAANTMGNLSASGTLRVRTLSLDSCISDSSLPIPTLIKMDIEGGEYAALRGAELLLKNHHPRLLVATHGALVHSQCCELLRSLGYELASLTNAPVESTEELIAT